MDPDQVGGFVRPDLGPNCLQRLLAEDTYRQRVKSSNLGPQIYILQKVKIQMRYSMMAYHDGSADPEGGGGDSESRPPPPPWKITSYMGLNRN